MAMCVMAVNTATMNGVAAECRDCVCENGPTEATACNAMCWGLVNCYGANCMDMPNGMADSACAANKCAQFLGGATGATALGMIIRADCSSECVAAEPDAGEDAGN
jgi:hypothetical protein